MALRTQTLNRGNIVTPICQYWPLAAEVGFTRGVEMAIVVVASEGQGGDPPSNDYCCLPPQLSRLDTKEEISKQSNPTPGKSDSICWSNSYSAL